MTACSTFFVLPTLRTLTAPLEASEDGRDLYGRETELRAEEFLPRRVLRERVVEGVPELDSPPDPGPMRSSSSSGIDSAYDGSLLLRGRIDCDLADDGLEAIGVSGTGASAAAAGGRGGGRPSMPPVLGTPGSAVRMRSTSSSVVMMNWTNALWDQWYLPNDLR